MKIQKKNLFFFWGGGRGQGAREGGQGGCEELKFLRKFTNQSRTNGPKNAHLTITQV